MKKAVKSWEKYYQSTKFLSQGCSTASKTPFVTIGGTSAYFTCDTQKYETMPYNLIDNNQWHNINLDARIFRAFHQNVRELYAFRLLSPDNTTTAGQQFWLTEFGIWPLREVHAKIRRRKIPNNKNF